MNSSEKKIGELVEGIYRGSPVATKYKGTGSFPAITSGDLRKINDVVIRECVTFVREDLVSGVLCEPGDILMIYKSMSKGITGRTFVYEGKTSCVVAQEIYIIKHKQNPRFLVHTLNSANVQKQIKFLSQEKRESEIRSQISISNLKNISVYAPSIQEQDRIAEQLDSLWNTRTQIFSGLEQLLEKRKKQYEHYKERLLIGEIDRWEKKTISEIAREIFVGAEVFKTQLGTGDCPAVKCGDINSRLDIFFTEKESISLVDENLLITKKYFEYGDILISEVGEKKTAGSAVAYLGQRRGIVGKSVYALRHDQNPKYISHALSSKFCRKQIEKFSWGAAIIHIYMKDIKKIELPLPPLEEQEKIVEKLEEHRLALVELEGVVKELIEVRGKQYAYYSEKALGN